MLLRSLIFCTAFLLSGCITSGKTNFSVLQINDLASEEKNTGNFKGLEHIARADKETGKLRVNIMYLHGIGWTEDRSADQLAGDFLGGIAKAYNLDATDGLVTTLCGEAPYTASDASKSHIYIEADAPRIYETSIPGSQLRLDDLVCMDKQVLAIDDTLEFVLYRVFWDNIFWDNIQFAHVGQDDDRGSSQELAALRRKFNRKLKDDLVNYGFSDAVMYLGEAGKDIRRAVRGAMCSAALDAAGYPIEKQGNIEKRLKMGRACATATNAPLDLGQFAFVTESLGSKIMFDVMRDAMTDGRQSIHDDMIRGSETYMLANQIPLLSLSDLSQTPTKRADRFKPGERPRLVAMSEVNDFLSYELVPFYEQLYKRSIRANGDQTTALTDAFTREIFIENLGFDIVDLRLEFADRVVSMVSGFVDPKDAHSGHAGEPELMRYLLCGTNDGQLHLNGCRAAEAKK